MNIILDTNILRKDLKLKDKNYDILVDYLEKTNSKIMLPKIVFEEILGLYKRLLVERQQEFKTALNKFNGTLINQQITLPPDIDAAHETGRYADFIKNRFHLTEDSIIAYKNEYLEQLVQRAISRKKPLDGNGQQFRDGLLWLTLLDIADSQEEKRVVFISDNPNDFGEKGSNKLAKELQLEAQEKNIEINFFKSIADFAKEHATKVTFITNEWIQEKIDITQLETIFNQVITNEDDTIREYYEDELEQNETSTGYINDSTYINSHIGDFTVYELSDGRILLNIDVNFEKEYEVEITREVENDRSSWEYQYNINPHTGDMDYEPIYIPRIDYETEHDYKMIYPLFIAKFVITIVDEKAVNYEFKEWDFS